MNPISTTPKAFDLTRACALAASSMLAYQCCTDLGDGVLRITDRETDTAALILSRGENITISFRGTVDLRNWLVNLDVIKEPLFNGGRLIQVHSGFLRAADRLIPEIIQALLPPGADKAKLKPIWITGHSLGGALATLAAYSLAFQGFPVAGVYTFASPRVGNANWRQAYAVASLQGITWRVAAAGDLVPLIPGLLTPPLDGYRHVGQEAYLTNGIFLNPSRMTEITCDAWRAYRALRRRDWDFILKFHSLDADYIKFLNQCRQPVGTN